MNSETPKYIAPPPDPGLATLTAQNEQQQFAAISDRTSAASARLMQLYGTRVAMTGAQVAPLLAPSVSAGSPFGAGVASIFQPGGSAGGAI